MVATITPQSLAEKMRQGDTVELIDVRTPAEFEEVHVESARNVPLDRLDASGLAADRRGNGHGPLYLICRSGGRSRQACEKLMAAGLGEVVSVEGGTSACESAGLPVVRGRKTMSLERQVRIAAGALVVIGAALAASDVEPLDMIGLGLAGFVGAGLVFAGITDTCGMAMLIARMPWNQRTGCGNATSCSTRSLLAGLLAATAAVATAAAPTDEPLPNVRAAVAAGKAVIVDVREQREWQQGHLAGARLVPLSALERGLPAEQLARVLPKDKVIYCHCAYGGRCLEAADILRPLGYDVRPLASGYDDLVNAGFPAAVTPLR